MPVRDDQEFESKRQQIINGALEVFAHKGFEKATNKDIAEAAGIGSPGLIYHYFKDKEDLFRQVIEHRATALQLVTRNEAQLMQLPPREALTLFATTFLKMFDQRPFVALFKLMLGEALRRPGVTEMVKRIGPERAFDFFARYLTKQMDAGVMRRMHPGAATRSFIGPLVGYIITREVFHFADTKELPSELMAQTAVDIFLCGMLIDKQEPEPAADP
jgi:AcrR family transcriptional regulator